MTRYLYYIDLTNRYTGISKRIGGQTRAEVELKVAEQLRKWKEQEQSRLKRERIADLKQQAEFDSEQARARIEEWRALLASTLQVDDRLDWDALSKVQPYFAFSFAEAEPTLDHARQEIGVPPERKLLEAVMKTLRRRREEKEGQAAGLFQTQMTSYRARLAKAKKKYEANKTEYESEQEDYNKALDDLRAEFEAGHGDAIEKYVHMVLERSAYPEGLERNYDIQYDPISQTIIVSFELPNREAVPRVLEYKYATTRQEVTPVEMKAKDFDLFFEETLYQICLRTIHEIFESVYIDGVTTVVFNGWVSGVDVKTGKDFRSCVLTCSANRDEYESYNLERVEPKECFRGMKGIAACPLAQLAPVRPIMDIRRDDRRFVESREVVGHLDSSVNLATMDWGDFEHLVRELFEKVFGHEIFGHEKGEVRVTQASRDGGVDAVAFDPDPIRGGKFVIQAKRYNSVVPVAAVRDLYGTMINEGANRGILVTTSYFGNDSREFAKDKPITLIDGANLVYLFQEHGHDVKIELQERGRPS